MVASLVDSTAAVWAASLVDSTVAVWAVLWAAAKGVPMVDGLAVSRAWRWDDDWVFWLVGMSVVAKVSLSVVGSVVGLVAWKVASSVVVKVVVRVDLWVVVMGALSVVRWVVVMVGMMVDQ